MLCCTVQQCKQVCSQFTSPRTLLLGMPRMMPLYLLKKLKLFVSASKRTGTTKDSTCSLTSPPAFPFCQLKVQSVSIMHAAAFKSKGSHSMSFLATAFKGEGKLQNKSFEMQKSTDIFQFLLLSHFTVRYLKDYLCSSNIQQHRGAIYAM